MLNNPYERADFGIGDDMKQDVTYHVEFQNHDDSGYYGGGAGIV